MPPAPGQRHAPPRSGSKHLVPGALHWKDPSEASEEHTLVGVTLPGVPAVVVGSNTHVAWGFTNTYADWSDVVLLRSIRQCESYRTPTGGRFRAARRDHQGGRQADRREVVTWTMWGPVIAPDYRGTSRAYRWVAHAADRLATSLVPSSGRAPSRKRSMPPTGSARRARISSSPILPDPSGGASTAPSPGVLA